jgi:hypothetical protein
MFAFAQMRPNTPARIHRGSLDPTFRSIICQILITNEHELGLFVIILCFMFASIDILDPLVNCDRMNCSELKFRVASDSMFAIHRKYCKCLSGEIILIPSPFVASILTMARKNSNCARKSSRQLS